jgi:AcrR family transcriptional regulator
MAAERDALVPQLAEVFRAHGFEGTSLALITAEVGLGKGSLYHYFPGGKDEMAEAVLAHIERWFDEQVFAALRGEAVTGIARMFDACEQYFHSGQRVCIVGVFALSSTRERFALAVKRYFDAWTRALQDALQRAGHGAAEAAALAEDIVGAIQGALVLARAVNEPQVFVRTLVRWRQRALPPGVGP